MADTAIRIPNAGRQPMKVPEHAADHERQHAGGGARRAQAPTRRRLLPAAGSFGDQRDQRRHDHRARRAGKAPAP